MRPGLRRSDCEHRPWPSVRKRRFDVKLSKSAWLQSRLVWPPSRLSVRLSAPGCSRRRRQRSESASDSKKPPQQLPLQSWNARGSKWSDWRESGSSRRRWRLRSGPRRRLRKMSWTAFGRNRSGKRTNGWRGRELNVSESARSRRLSCAESRKLRTPPRKRPNSSSVFCKSQCRNRPRPCERSSPWWQRRCGRRCLRCLCRCWTVTGQ
mmetsp:Transcript_9801/g.22500  ORF Transcript_9801/g.22500 Transcript_9801/m.22500 type:complete len:208 (+) Transcript_9801:553-1176(+)